MSEFLIVFTLSMGFIFQMMVGLIVIATMPDDDNLTSRKNWITGVSTMIVLATGIIWTNNTIRFIEVMLIRGLN